MSTCETKRPPARRNRIAHRFARYLAFTASFALWPADALASDVFPPVIRERLELAADPPCTICHLTDEGEDGTVVKPFGVSMMRLGVHGDSDTQSLVAALAAANDQQVDSDEDGIADITELRDGADPNDGPGASTLPIPRTGCAIGTNDSGIPAMLAVLAGVAVARIRRRRLSPGVTQHASRLPRQC